MKYIVLATMLCLSSVDSFAVGQNSSPDKTCCDKEGGGCKTSSGSLMPQCNPMRNPVKRDFSKKITIPKGKANIQKT